MSPDVPMQMLANVISSHPKLSDELLAERIVSTGVDSDIAELALALLPFAFARVLFKRTSFGPALRLSDVADIGPAGGEPRRVSLTDIPFYREARDFALRSFDTSVFRPDQIISIAGRSAEFHLINSLILEKKSIADFVFSPPRFLRLPQGPIQPPPTSTGSSAPDRV